MTASQNTDTTDKRTDDKEPAYAEPHLNIAQDPFFVRVNDEDARGRAEIDTEVWPASQTSEARIYIHGEGDLQEGGEFGLGFSMSYLQARQLRDLLDGALDEFDGIEDSE